MLGNEDFTTQDLLTSPHDLQYASRNFKFGLIPKVSSELMASVNHEFLAHDERTYRTWINALSTVVKYGLLLLVNSSSCLRWLILPVFSLSPSLFLDSCCLLLTGVTMRLLHRLRLSRRFVWVLLMWRWSCRLPITCKSTKICRNRSTKKQVILQWKNWLRIRYNKGVAVRSGEQHVRCLRRSIVKGRIGKKEGKGSPSKVMWTKCILRCMNNLYSPYVFHVQQSHKKNNNKKKECEK